ncbi:hypothetical protein K438DRAFT_2050308 [Mycena galopus ATCC 62051]|nr:hypothetical protein K438DRAFT_2050308 [Mycena galopus ATCC 62051]
MEAGRLPRNSSSAISKWIMRNLGWTYRSLDKLQDAEELEALLRDEEMCYKESKLHWVSQSTSLAAVEADFEYLEQCQKKYGSDKPEMIILKMSELPEKKSDKDDLQPRDFKVPRISICLFPQLVKMVRVQPEEREDAVLDSDWSTEEVTLKLGAGATSNDNMSEMGQELRIQIISGTAKDRRQETADEEDAGIGMVRLRGRDCWSRRWRTIMRQEGIPSDGRDNYTEEEIRVKSDEYGTCVRFGQLREIRDTNQSSREFHNLAERFSWHSDGNQRNFPASSLEDSIGETRTTAETDGEKPGEERTRAMPFSENSISLRDLKRTDHGEGQRFPEEHIWLLNDMA